MGEENKRSPDKESLRGLSQSIIRPRFEPWFSPLCHHFLLSTSKPLFFLPLPLPIRLPKLQSCQDNAYSQKKEWNPIFVIFQRQYQYVVLGQLWRWWCWCRYPLGAYSSKDNREFKKGTRIWQGQRQRHVILLVEIGKMIGLHVRLVFSSYIFLPHSSK